MSIDRDIEILTEQEGRLQFERFDRAAAWQLGCRLRALCEARQAAAAIEVRLLRETMFFVALDGATAANADWVRRKRNTVELLEQSSYRVGRALERDGVTLEQKMGLPLRDYATHGGSFPIFVQGLGCVGAVTVSGLPQREDHSLVVAALVELCQLPAGELSLPAEAVPSEALPGPTPRA